MQHSLFVTLLLLFTGVYACNRPDPVHECCYDCTCNYPCPNTDDFTYPYKDTLYQNDTFLSYWYFPEGSWWVYKRRDTTAEVYDTARVISQDRGIGCDCQFLGDVCRERAMQEINHSYHFTLEEQAPEQNVSVTMDTNLRIDWVFAHGGTSLLGGGTTFHNTL